MSMKAITSYYSSNLYKPFFVIVGDEEYTFTKAKLVEAGGIEFIRLSDYCRSSDKRPDMDKLRETLRMADVDCNSNKLALLGLGEYLALEGEDYAKCIIDELKDFNLGCAHVVILLRGIATQVKSIADGDIRFANRGQVVFGENLSSSIVFSFSSMDLGMFERTGLKEALRLLENGETMIQVNTSLKFSDSLYPIQVIRNPYEAVCKKVRGLALSSHIGSEDMWEELLKEINQHHSLEKVFIIHEFDFSEHAFYKRISGSEYEHWLYYVYLITHKDEIANSYLRYILSISESFDELKYNVLNAISSVSHKDESFKALYDGRKRLIEKYPEAELAVFVANNRENMTESIYKLTDGTNVEKEEIIAEIAQHGMPENLADIYPALALYLEKYHFQSDALSELLTQYFEDYKQQKVRNTLEDCFIQQVDELAESRVYNRLRTRDELVEAIDKDAAFLCWIDALGIEYLSFIVGLAKRRGLAISINIGRTELPTITAINSNFYLTWPDEHKRKIEELDEIKHKEKGGYKFGPQNKYAIHLARELTVIENAVDEAATMLALRKYDTFIIASDHGASRLAVLRQKEEKYETDTRGEHSGRCCKVFSNYDLPFATEEHGFIVLADYGRFKGSRAANVEVHGGASLEEVLVPVITLSLRDTSIKISLGDEVIKADPKKGIEITLYVNKIISMPLSIRAKGKQYAGKKIDDTHYKVAIQDIKHKCTQAVDVYLGEDLVSQIVINAESKSGSVNDDFDDMF